MKQIMQNGLLHFIKKNKKIAVPKIYRDKIFKGWGNIFEESKDPGDTNGGKSKRAD